MEYIKIITTDYNVIVTDTEHYEFKTNEKCYVVENPLQVRGKMLVCFDSLIELKKESPNKTEYDPRYGHSESCLDKFKIKIPVTSVLVITHSKDKPINEQ